VLRDERGDGGRRPVPARNVLGEPLEICSFKPMTGFYRDGCCNTGQEDIGSHTVCAVMTAEFLAFSKSRGNDLSTPVPEFGFPGLKPGDRWCLCAPRWQEAFHGAYNHDCAARPGRVRAAAAAGSDRAPVSGFFHRRTAPERGRAGSYRGRRRRAPCRRIADRWTV
jgi:uncharacterized protein (DUF2237 family)